MDIIWLDTVDIILWMCPRPQFQVGNSLHILLQRGSPGCSVPVLSGGEGGESIRIDKISPPRLKFAAVPSTL